MEEHKDSLESQQIPGSNPPEQRPPEFIQRPLENQRPIEQIQETVTRSIYSHLLNDINNSFLWRYRWAKIANYTSSLSEVLVVAAAIMCFIAGFYEIKSIAFSAGVTNILAFSCKRMSIFSKNESSIKTNTINGISKSINVNIDVYDLTDFSENTVLALEQHRIVPA